MTQKRDRSTERQQDGEEGTLNEQANKIRCEALLPTISQARYEEAFRKFMDWRQENYPSDEVNENALLVYLKHLSETFAPSSLWTVYSMLKRQMLVSSTLF
jgi:hypothetical protein